MSSRSPATTQGVDAEVTLAPWERLAGIDVRRSGQGRGLHALAIPATRRGVLVPPGLAPHTGCHAGAYSGESSYRRLARGKVAVREQPPGHARDGHHLSTWHLATRRGRPLGRASGNNGSFRAQRRIAFLASTLLMAMSKWPTFYLTNVSFVSFPKNQPMEFLPRRAICLNTL
jgi:hypothetical protein